ncbi:MAG: Fur family transcriptional regulator [Chloroflexota bacterium]
MNQRNDTKQIIERLRAGGAKITPARKAIVHSIHRNDHHLIPNDIWIRAKEQYPAVGRATVYRTLELLTQLGILRPIYTGPGSLSYIWAEGGHHHVVCSSCGDILEFEECVVGELMNRLEDQYGYQIHSHLLEFYGLCYGCQEQD